MTKVQTFLIAAILSWGFSTNAETISMSPEIKQFLNEKQTIKTISVIVTYKHRPQKLERVAAQKIELLRNTQFQEEQFLSGLKLKSKPTSLWIANATLITLSKSELLQILANTKSLSVVKSLNYANRKVELNPLTPSVHASPQVLPIGPFTYGLENINWPALQVEEPALNGSGVRVGIIDTGIDPRHPDLVGKTKLFRDFVFPRSTSAYDDNGHGTHVAGTIAGGNSSRTAIGVAPKAELLVAKAFSALGSSVDSELLMAMQWMADPDGNPQTQDHAHVLSASWNVDADHNGMSPSDEPFCKAIENLSALGIHSVFSSGNDGSSANTIKIPGACPMALTVGATDDEDVIADFSSRGPVRWKTMSLQKPEISAPGMYVWSADRGGSYRYRSGTSMAVPHVAGAMALMVQANPQMSVTDRQNVLTAASQDLGPQGRDTIYGQGRLDILKAYQAVAQSTQWLDPNDIRPDHQLLRNRLNSNITEAEFNAVIDEIERVYDPIVSRLGGNLSMNGDWKSETPNAAARQMFSNWEVRTTGGLARHPELTKDGFSLILCHELGHHLGGFAFAPAQLPIPIVSAWAANEGQSDYFATQFCARKIWGSQTQINAEFRRTATAEVKDICNSTWEETNEQNLCYRILTGVESMVTTMATLMNKPIPEFSTPDATVVAKTNHGHPAVQCRLDTALQGSICKADFNENLIPGKKAQGGVDSLNAEREAAQVSCTAASGYDVGLRPTCWFKARM